MALKNQQITINRTLIGRKRGISLSFSQDEPPLKKQKISPEDMIAKGLELVKEGLASWLPDQNSLQQQVVQRKILELENQLQKSQ